MDMDYEPSHESEYDASSDNEIENIVSTRKKRAGASEKFTDDNVLAKYRDRISSVVVGTDLIQVSDDLLIPQSLWNKLYDFQQKGVLWLARKHYQGCGAVLADEMGLGKSVQVCAFIRALCESQKNDRSSLFYGFKNTLLICPASLIIQWANFWRDYAPLMRIVIVHNSAAKEQSIDKILQSVVNTIPCFTVVLTSYHTFNIHNSAFAKLRWSYLIADEAHVLKNPTLKTPKYFKDVKADHRILMTGTPLQNNLRELWSLMDCACPKRFGELKTFMRDVARPITHGGWAQASMEQKATAARCAAALRDAIQPYMIRRTKLFVESELRLPVKKEHVLFCRLTKLQKKLYLQYLQSNAYTKIVEDRTLLPFSGITMLSKICNHPDIAIASKSQYFSFNTRSTDKVALGHPSLSGKLQVAERMLKVWKHKNIKVLLFSQSKLMLDTITNMLDRKKFSYKQIDGTTPMSQRQAIISNFAQDDTYILAMTTRVGGLGFNITAATKVIIFDPCWNPAVDAQARERAWRIGQQKPVTIYRLISFGTVEEKIYERQIFKELLAQRVLSRQVKFAASLKSTDLRGLFSLCDSEDYVTSTKKNKFKAENIVVIKKHVIEDSPSKSKKAEKRKSSSLDETSSKKKQSSRSQTRESSLKDDGAEICANSSNALKLNQLASSSNEGMHENEDDTRDEDDFLSSESSIPFLVKHEVAQKRNAPDNRSDDILQFVLNDDALNAINENHTIGIRAGCNVNSAAHNAKRFFREAGKRANSIFVSTGLGTSRDRPQNVVDQEVPKPVKVNSIVADKNDEEFDIRDFIFARKPEKHFMLND